MIAISSRRCKGPAVEWPTCTISLRTGGPDLAAADRYVPNIRVRHVLDVRMPKTSRLRGRLGSGIERRRDPDGRNGPRRFDAARASGRLKF
jgi:hypothetical protein